MAHEENQGNDLPLPNMSTLVTYNPYFIVTVGSLISVFFYYYLCKATYFLFFFFFFSVLLTHVLFLFLGLAMKNKQTNN